jgi:D-3-phosphoglycerate dehydrogenase
VTMEKKILIGPSSFAEKDKSPIDLLIKAGFRLVDNPYKRKLTKAELLLLLDDDVIGLIAGLETLDREVLSKSKLKCISRVGAGISNIDLAAAREFNIGVKSTPDAPTQAVAEMTIGALLNLLRLIPLMNEDLHKGKWTKKVGFQLEGKTCLVIGYGRIGKRVSSLLNAFRAKILVYDPFLEGKIDFEKVDVLTSGLSLADIVTIHSSGEECVLTLKEFRSMKQGVIVLNAARGNSIDETALVAGLESGKVSAAWLDTFVEEPYKGPLVGFSNVLLTPHVGSYTLECRSRMEIEAVNNLLSFIR